MFMVLTSWQNVIVRVHSVRLMNAETTQTHWICSLVQLYFQLALLHYFNNNNNNISIQS